MGIFIPPGVSTAGGSGTPGGNSGEAQFNNAGALAGAAGLTIDPTTGRLTLASFLAADSAPATPASAGFALYAAPTTGALSWKGANGFVREFNVAGNTADRAYQLQDKSGTLAHLDDVFPELYAVGNYITPANVTVANGAVVVANTIYLYPFRVERGIGFNELVARVNSGIASSTFQLAIYNNADGLPASLLASTADMSGASATILSSVVSESFLDPSRLYWFAVNSTAALSFSGPASGSTHANSVMGAPTLSVISSSINAAVWNRSFSQTYGTWPDLTGQITTAVSGSRCPVPILRVSALT